MHHLFKLIQGLSTHAMGGRGGIVQLGIRLLEMNKLVIEAVVFVVGYFGRILNVVEAGVVIKRSTQILRAGAKSR